MSKGTVLYLLRKLAVVLLTLFVVTLLSFLLMRLSPVDPATAYVKRHSVYATEEQIQAARIQLGLDKPLPVQYLRWVDHALHGDLGISLPLFYLATVVLDLFAVRWGIIRVAGNTGLGYLIIDAVLRWDSPVIHASVLLLAGALVLLDTAAQLVRRIPFADLGLPSHR